jgi:hypothetical protein
MFIPKQLLVFQVALQPTQLRRKVGVFNSVTFCNNNEEACELTKALLGGLFCVGGILVFLGLCYKIVTDS